MYAICLVLVFTAYLRGAGGKKKEVVQKIISRLMDIKTFFEKQRMLKFIASSLLIVYEGGMDSHLLLNRENSMGNLDSNVLDVDTKHSCVSNSMRADSVNTTPNEPSFTFCQDVEVRMIDMAHIFESRDPDKNYIFGVDSLISYFERQVNGTLNYTAAF